MTVESKSLVRGFILYFGKMHNVAVSEQSFVRLFVRVFLPSAILARVGHKDMA